MYIFKKNFLFALSALSLASGQVFAMGVPSGIPSSPALKDDAIAELQVMRQIYSAEYAPNVWKKAYYGWDLDTEINKAVAAINAKSDLSLKDAQKIIGSFVASMKDYHTTIAFLSTETSTLPLQIKGANGKYFIVYIDRTKLPGDSFPFNVGDEVVTFGGQPTKDVVDSVQAEAPAAIAGTDNALAELALTHRRAARGLNCPQGAVNLGILAQGANAVVNHQLAWDYTPESIAARPSAGATTALVFAPGTSNQFSSALMRPKMNVDFADQSLDTPYDLGGRQSFTPALGTKIWQSAKDSNFDSYIFKNIDGKLIGYVRIPQYEVGNNTPADFQAAVDEFAKMVDLMQATTDGMVLDQVNNPGGSVFYMYALASMLAKDSLATPRHRMAITQQDVSDALTQLDQLKSVTNDAQAKKLLGGTMDGFPASYEAARFTVDYLNFIVSEWNKGHKLSDPYWIGGADRLNPAASHYTKPILLLINHLDFSGGDFFPTVMQDNKRVTVMGSRTSGAGGYVNDIHFPNDLGIDAFRVTESIAERINQDPIENLGVSPDIAYEMTEADFTSNYSPYVKAIQNAIAGLTK